MRQQEHRRCDSIGPPDWVKIRSSTASTSPPPIPMGGVGGDDAPQPSAGGPPISVIQTPLTAEQILAWADEYRRLTGRWPSARSGAVPGAPGLSWNGVNEDLRQGLRGLPGGDSLARLLARRRGTRNRAALPHLTVEQILVWVDAHYQRTGRRPSAASGAVGDAPGETCAAIDQALSQGRRGLPGGDSLARLLGRCRGAASPRSWAPWTPAEDELARALPPAEVACRTRHTLGAVYHRRHLLGLPDGRRR
jgi:hypothetical protein